MLKDISWAQIYRPTTLDECVLPNEYRTMFEQIIKDEKIPDMIFYSRAAGVGKTTIARILCNTLNYDTLEINGSDENGIDVIRGRIQNHASSLCIDGERKAVIIDEADGVTDAAQDAFRGCIEKYSANCTFIFTCNNINRIKSPIRSRLAPFDFDFKPKDGNSLKVQMMKRAAYVLEKENVEYDNTALAQLINQEYPQFRNILLRLQTLSKLGSKIEKLDTPTSNFDEIVDLVSNVKWTEMRRWCAENYTLGMDNILNEIIQPLEDNMVDEHKPDFYQIVYSYQVNHTFAANTEICLAAMFSAIMTQCSFKK